MQLAESKVWEVGQQKIARFFQQKITRKIKWRRRQWIGRDWKKIANNHEGGSFKKMLTKKTIFKAIKELCTLTRFLITWRNCVLFYASSIALRLFFLRSSYLLKIHTKWNIMSGTCLGWNSRSVIWFKIIQRVKKWEEIQIDMVGPRLSNHWSLVMDVSGTVLVSLHLNTCKSL